MDPIIAGALALLINPYVGGILGLWVWYSWRERRRRKALDLDSSRRS